jgi:hypothetical protein
MILLFGVEQKMGFTQFEVATTCCLMKGSKKTQDHQIRLLPPTYGTQYGHCEFQGKSATFCGVPATNPSQHARTYTTAMSKLIQDVLVVTNQQRVLSMLYGNAIHYDEIWLAGTMGLFTER